MKIDRPQKRFNISVIFIGKYILIVLAAIFLFLFLSSATTSAQKGEKKILILFSAQSDTPAYGFISLLLVQRKRLSQQFQFEQTLSNLLARFVNLSPDQVGPQIEQELVIIGRLLEVDRDAQILDVNESWLRFARENDAGSLDRLGTGKELVARAIHNNSSRNQHPSLR
jgi:hypothetical protein